MIYLGIDPDLHTTGVGALYEDGTPMGAWCVRVSDDLKGRDAAAEMMAAISLFLTEEVVPLSRQIIAAVEAQELYRGAGQNHDTKNPRDILFLGHVAGSAFGCVAARCAYRYFPAPMTWKGNVPKQIHHARILSRFGWKYNKIGKDPKARTSYCRPDADLRNLIGAAALKRTDWLHVTDGLGLALYAKEQYELAIKMRKYTPTTTVS